MAKPKASAKVIHMSVDPLVSRHPFREYEADLLVAGDPVAGLKMLRQALAGCAKDKNGALDARRKTVAAARDDMLDEARQARRIGQGPDPDPSGVAWPLPQQGQGQGRGHRQRTRHARRIVST